MTTHTMRTDTSGLATPPYCSECRRRILAGETYQSESLPIGSKDFHGRAATAHMTRQTFKHASCPQEAK